jgi:hypothetical protein
MSVEMLYEPGVSAFMEFRLRGAVRPQDFNDMTAFVVEQADHEKVDRLFILEDSEAARTSFPAFLASMTRQDVPDKNLPKRALVDPTGFSRNSAVLTTYESAGARTHVFATRDEAVAWLLEDES